MSKTLCIYPSMGLGDNYSHPMIVTAFVGGEYGYSVQFTIGGLYCALAENQVRDLRNTLTKRINSNKGYRATEWEDEVKEVAPDPKEERK